MKLFSGNSGSNPYKSFRSQMNLFLIAPCASGDFKIVPLNEIRLLISNWSVTISLSVVFEKKNQMWRGLLQASNLKIWKIEAAFRSVILGIGFESLFY